MWLGGVFDPDVFSLDEANAIPEDSYLDEEEELCAQVEAQDIVLSLLLKTLKAKHPDTYHLLYQAGMEASDTVREGDGEYGHCLADNIDSLFDKN